MKQTEKEKNAAAFASETISNCIITQSLCYHVTVHSHCSQGALAGVLYKKSKLSSSAVYSYLYLIVLSNIHPEKTLQSGEPGPFLTCPDPSRPKHPSLTGHQS